MQDSAAVTVPGAFGAPVDDPDRSYRGLRIHAAPQLHARCFEIIQRLALPPHSRVLDLGAGEGAFAQYLVDHGFSVTAVERDRQRFRADAPCHHLDLNDDFGATWSEPFDLVVAMEIIEHLSNPRHFVRNCLATLKPGRHLLISSPNVENWVSRLRFLRNGRFLWFDETDYEHYGHVTPVFSWQVEQIARENGAKLVFVGNTDNRFLWRRLGDTIGERLRNKSSYLSVLRALMKGHSQGEVAVYLVKKESGGADGPGRQDRATGGAELR